MAGCQGGTWSYHQWILSLSQTVFYYFVHRDIITNCKLVSLLCVIWINCWLVRTKKISGILDWNIFHCKWAKSGIQCSKNHIISGDTYLWHPLVVHLSYCPSRICKFAFQYHYCTAHKTGRFWYNNDSVISVPVRFCSLFVVIESNMACKNTSQSKYRPCVIWTDQLTFSLKDSWRTLRNYFLYVWDEVVNYITQFPNIRMNQCLVYRKILLPEMCDHPLKNIH